MVGNKLMRHKFKIHDNQRIEMRWTKNKNYSNRLKLKVEILKISSLLLNIKAKKNINPFDVNHKRSYTHAKGYFYFRKKWWKCNKNQLGILVEQKKSYHL